MSYLLDTNVVSEAFKPRADVRVVAWLGAVAAVDLHISVLTVGEIRKGIERPGLGAAKRQRILAWLETELAQWLGPRILPVSLDVATRWGLLLARAGRSLPTVDSLLAATALEHDLQLVTRNVKDFGVFENLRLVNPWDG